MTGVQTCALPIYTTGSYNIAVGGGALNANTTANYNVAMGWQALGSNTTASNNTAVGYQAGYSNTTGAENVSIGYQANYSLVSGTRNVSVGRSAGYSNTGNYNTLIGDQAGFSLTSGTNNVIVGPSNAGYSMTTGSKNTIIGGFSGNAGGLDIRTASNYVVLSDGDGNPRGIFDGSGNFLVGTTSSTTTPANGVQLNNPTTNSTVAVGHASGTASGNYYLNFGYAGTNIGSVTQSGTTAVLYNTTSDQRLKENIQDADDASALVDYLQVRQFDWKADGSHQRYGFVAQELVQVVPEAVHQPENPNDMMAVDYSKLVPMLVKELQSLRKRVAELEAK